VSASEELTGELVELTSLQTGVIVGVPVAVSPRSILEMKHELEKRFPGVRFEMLAGVSGMLSFTFDPDAEESEGR
jgi:hypothetical protein